MKKTSGLIIAVFVSFLFFFMMGGMAGSQDWSSCAADYERYCKGPEASAEPLKCLLGKSERLTRGCKEYVALLAASWGEEAPAVVPAFSTVGKGTSVPKEFRSTYDSLAASLRVFEDRLKPIRKRKEHPVVFGAELVPADSNRGRELLSAEAREEVVQYLDRLRELGVQGVTMSMNYPLYTPAFPGYREYVAFYKDVAREVRARGMKLCVEAGVVLSNTGFSGLRVSFTTLTFNRYKTEKREMVTAILRDVAPDYLNVGSEPDTEAAVTGLRELNDPQRYTEYLTYILEGQVRGLTKTAAGVGSWSSLAFPRSFAKFTSIDALAIHVYPITDKSMDNIFAIAGIAREFGKGIIIDEAWLLKSDRYSAGGSATWAPMFRQDSFRFWTPLDQKFLSLIARFARVQGVDYLSPSRTGCFFAYMEYDEKNANRPYRDVNALHNRAVLADIREGKRTSTGEYYRILIDRNLDLK